MIRKRIGLILPEEQHVSSISRRSPQADSKKAKKETTSMGNFDSKIDDDLLGAPLRNYDAWVRERTLTRLESADPSAPADWNYLITVVLFAPADSTNLFSATIRSLRLQTYRNIEVLVVGADFASASFEATLADYRGLLVQPQIGALEILNNPDCDHLWRGDYIFFVPTGTTFEPDAFALFNGALQTCFGANAPSLLVFDSDSANGDQRYAEPAFVPGWDPDLILQHDYIRTAFLASRGLVVDRGKRGHLTTIHEWLCELANRSPAPRAVSLNEPVVHFPAGERRSDSISIVAHPADRLPSLGRVAIIIPNRNRPELLRQCLGFIEFPLRFEPEIVVVDNGSDDPEVRDLYIELQKRCGARIVSADRRFNFSTMMNVGIAASESETLLFLNNDVEVSRRGLLEEILVHVSRPEVGVVGSHLYYPDGTIQHAGMILKPSGNREYPIHAHHVLRGARIREDASLQPWLTVRNYQAVTGALMATRRDVIQRVGGFDEVAFPVEFNDVDFCLRVRQAGMRVIVVPADGIYHPERSTRGSESPPEVVQMRRRAMTAMWSRWPHEIHADPFVNPWLDVGERPSPVLHPHLSNFKARKRRNHGPVSQMLRAFRRKVRARLRRALTEQAELRRIDAAMAAVVVVSERKWTGAVPSRPKDGLCIAGYLRSEVGLGQAARNLAYACDLCRVPTSYRSLALPDRNNDPEFITKSNDVSDRKANLFVSGLDAAASLIPELGRGQINIFYPFWELGRVPQGFAPLLDQFDEIWTPSNFIKDAMSDAFSKAVRLVPQPVRLPPSPSPPRAHRDTLKVLTYLDFDSFASRKNPQAVVQTFLAAFPASQRDVELIIKTRGHEDGGVRKWLKTAARNDQRIRVVDQTFDRAKMDALIADCDAFVSLHRSEGFGFGPAEALAATKPVVATDFGGSTDFVATSTGYPVPYTLVPVRPGEYLHCDDQLWAEPNQEAAIAALRRLYDAPDEAYARALAGFRLLQDRHSTFAVGAVVENILKTIGAL